MTASTTAWRAKRRRRGRARFKGTDLVTMTRMGKAAGAWPRRSSCRGASAAPAQAQDQPALREGVVALVNDDVITNYDIVQRMRLIVVTAGIQPTGRTQPQLRALRPQRADRRAARDAGAAARGEGTARGTTTQIVATDAVVDERIADIAQAELPHDRRSSSSTALQQRGIGPTRSAPQIRAQISWQRWIRGPLRRFAA